MQECRENPGWVAYQQVAWGFQPLDMWIFVGATLGDRMMTLQLQHVQPSFISFWPFSFDRSSRRSCPLVLPDYCCFNLSKVKRIQQLTFTLNQSVCQEIIQIFGHVPTFCWWRPHVDVGCFKLVRIKFPKTSANIRGFKYTYIYIYTANAWVLPGPAMTTGDASSSSSSSELKPY